MSITIYLAGPDVFLPDAAEMGRRKQQICREFGFEGLFPLDYDASVSGDPAKIFRANCRLMKKDADVGLFNLTPFRGPSPDPGTVFELGFMAALGKPIFGYTSASSTYRERVEAALGSLVKCEQRLCDRDGYKVEDFRLHDNLMIAQAILESSGGLSVVREAGDASNSLAALSAFRACLQFASEFLGRTKAASNRNSDGDD
jgi:nucleoside 2-deoxyribosyltransferase